MANRLKEEALLSRLFTPAAPINDRMLFAGRQGQARKILDALNLESQHVVIYGERGVGKTSMANTVASLLVEDDDTRIPILAPHVNCDSSDTFASTWKKVFAQIQVLTSRSTAGYRTEVIKKGTLLSDQLPKEAGLEDVRQLLESIPGSVIFIDEFDRLKKRQDTQLFSDFIKALSDFRTNVKVVLVGVADSIEDLVVGHASVERCISQVFMPRMLNRELEEIVTTRLQRAGMSCDQEVPIIIAKLSQGFPHYTHLLGLYSARAALNRDSIDLNKDDVFNAIAEAVDQAQASIRSTYQAAVRSSRKGALYEQVLLACALAEPDDLGFFAAADVREPLSSIMKKPFDIPRFVQHLSRFCEDDRKNILEKKGSPRMHRYRFSNPLVRPYVSLKGHQRGWVPEKHAIV
jgi:Cdc6-like AAA superfamily ATPase